jgi:hypothetical protein
MDRQPELLPSFVEMQPFRRFGRRDFLKQCGFFGLAATAVTLTACETGPSVEQEEPPSQAFFVDGTDFAD